MGAWIYFEFQPDVSRFRSSSLSALVTLCSQFASPAHASAQVLDVSTLGGACYDLSLGAWQPAESLRNDSIFIAPPSRVRFDTLRAERRPDDFVLRTAPGALPSVHRSAIWRPVGRDSVRLLWTTGFSGLRMTLGGQPHELRGQAQAFWDFPRTPFVAAATARRVPCDSPAQPGETAQRFVPRTVHLEGGDSVVVGAPFGALRAQSDSLRGRTYTIRRAPVGLFAGASAIEVSVNASDTVWRVAVNYPPATELESLVVRLATVLGPPVSRDTVPLSRSQLPASILLSWSNRTTWFTLHQGSVIGGGVRISAMLVDPRLR